MSISQIYAIYDEASESFVQFLPCANEKLARMTIETLFNNHRFTLPMIYDYPNNFSVYCLGTFDDNKGLFENLPQHTLLLNLGSISSSSIPSSSDT